MEARAGSGVSPAAPHAAASGRDPGRVLVVRLGAIGDCLRVLPSVVRLRRALPGADIGWVVSDLVAPLLEGHPAVTRLHVVRRRELRRGLWPAWSELRRAGRELASHRYDVAIDFHTRLKSGYLTLASGAPVRIGLGFRSGTEANFLFTNCHVTIQDSYENRVLRFARLLAPLGISNGLELADRAPWVAPDALENAQAIYAAADRPDVAIFAGTSDSRSHDRWPPARWRQVAASLAGRGITSMVLWGPDEMETAGGIADGVHGCRLAPPTTLPEMMALLGLFRLYAGANTAALHMAWMQGVPAVVLAGGRPWRTDRPLAPVPSEMLSAGGVEPDRKLRGEAARRAIEGIEAADVVAAAVRLLG